MAFTDQDRQIARTNSAAQRKKQQMARREKVREMFDAGMPKTGIAKELSVHLTTVYQDLKGQ